MYQEGSRMGRSNCLVLSAFSEASTWFEGLEQSGLMSEGFKTMVMSILSDWTFSVSLMMEDISMADELLLDDTTRTIFTMARKRRFENFQVQDR
jgi:hypothetical protein